MKTILKLTTFLFFCLHYSAQAQTFGNEWINYSQSYYKFKIAQNGIFRIPISNLFAIGMPSSTVGSSVQLYRDGVQIPIIISNNSALTNNDYIEFYGEKANGNLDKRLHIDTNKHLNPEQNLVSDTAVYFVTIAAPNSGLRLTQLPNTLVSLPSKENYIWRVEKLDYRTEFARGESAVEGQYQASPLLTLNSGQYELEGYVKKFTTTKDSVTITCVNPYTISAAPNAIFNSRVVGKSYIQNHQIKVFANGNLIVDSTYAKFNFTKLNASIPMSSINSTNNQFKFIYEPSTNTQDRYGISTLYLSYPSTTDFNNVTNQYFELAPKTSSYYLEISNFNKANEKPKLFDITSNSYLIGDTSIASIVRFLIPASTSIKKFFLQSAVASTYKNITGLENVVFKNYNQLANQGDYLIIADQRFSDDGFGNNYLNDYKNYRSSIAGGSYHATINYLYDIYNEFGYGYDFSTLAVKNFLSYSFLNDSWNYEPKHALIIGKGIEYPNFLAYQSANKQSYAFYATPTFGQPGSDWLFTDFYKTGKPLLSIGRISAFNANDISIYLQKVKDYETVQANTSNLSSDKAWQKRILHIGGISDSLQSLPIRSALDREARIIEGTYFGANATIINKSKFTAIEKQNSQLVDSFFNNGSSIIYFFGHSSASAIDYGLDFPERYSNYKKYPLMIANGCGAGNIFIYTGQKYLSERFLFTPNAGAIGFIACVNSGFSGTLGLYTDSLYGEIAKTSYGLAIGEQMRVNINKLMSNQFIGNDLLFRMHAEQILLNGDPAIKLFSPSLPDYSIEKKYISINPNNPTTSNDSIDVTIKLQNLGKFTSDSVYVEIRRYLPNGTFHAILKNKIPAFANTKDFNFKIPTYNNAGVGTNSITVSIDNITQLNEVSESNNYSSLTFQITNSGAKPIFPFEFSIVGSQPIALKSTTLNLFEQSLPYVIEIDTTEKFNSPLFETTIINSAGGVISWTPGITYQDSIVYYWRIAVNTTPKVWHNSSFVYITNSDNGWNQSHYYQFLKDTFNASYIDSTNRELKYIKTKSTLQAQNVCLNGVNPFNYGFSDYFVKMNGSSIYSFGCDPYPGYSSLQFVVIDSLTGKPWINKRPDPAVAVGRYGSFSPCRISVNGEFQDPFFQFDFSLAVNRKKMMDFIDSIPSGNYIMIQPQLCVGTGCGTTNKLFVNNWKADTTTLGANNSLYHKLKNMGFTKIDSFTKNRPMLFWTRKNEIASVQQIIGSDSTEKLFGEFQFENLEEATVITSTIIGPSTQWVEFKQNLSSVENLAGDNSYFEIYGIKSDGSKTKLSTVLSDTTLTHISASTYPYLQLKYFSTDTNYRTPEQLNYWRIYYQPVPEGAINPASMYTVTDGILPNTKVIKVAFENLTNIAMDSLLVRFNVLNSRNEIIYSETKRISPLAASDSIQIEYTLNTSNLFSSQLFQLEVNPVNDQIEQFHPNNFALRSIGAIDPSVPLPVTLSNFIVFENKCDASIIWNTVSEEDFDRYEIERKGVSNFQKIASIYSKGNAANNEYHFVDKDLTPGTYNYRLKMIDIDGKFSYSPEKSVEIDCKNSDEIYLFPNPSSDFTNLFIQSDIKKEITIQTIDFVGKTVYSNTIDIKEGVSVIPISIQSLARGIYHIRVIDGNAIKIIKLNKQ